MSPILHIVRHAEGFHQTTPPYHQIHDPHLTPSGLSRSHDLAVSFPRHAHITLLLSSPLIRALETCQIAFAPAIQRGLKVVAVPDAQEATSEACDVGSDPEVLKGMVDERVVELGEVGEGWNSKEGVFGTEAGTTIERARRLRKWILAKGEQETVLVTHGNFAHFITGEVDKKGTQTTPFWSNTELRTYTFVEGDTDEAKLVETEESVEQRKDVAPGAS